MDIYRSRYTAEQLDDTIGLVHGLVVPRVGPNGNWFVGDTDTGVYARGLALTNSGTVGQILEIETVDSDGRPATFKSVNIPSASKWKLLRSLKTSEEVGTIEITTSDDGRTFSHKQLRVYVKVPQTTGTTSVTCQFCTQFNTSSHVHSNLISNAWGGRESIWMAEREEDITNMATRITRITTHADTKTLNTVVMLDGPYNKIKLVSGSVDLPFPIGTTVEVMYK